MDPVARELELQSSWDRHGVINSRMSFSNTNTALKEVGNPIVVCDYKCDATKKAFEQCDFSTCINTIDNDPKLLTLKTRDFCSLITWDIARNQKAYLPHVVDGFCISKGGRSLLHMEREGSSDKSVTGQIEWFDFRQDTLAARAKRHFDTLCEWFKL
jgi:hypothetical protein